MRIQNVSHLISLARECLLQCASQCFAFSFKGHKNERIKHAVAATSQEQFEMHKTQKPAQMSEKFKYKKKKNVKRKTKIS